MDMATHTSTLDRMLTSELAVAAELIGEVKATGPALVALNLVLESIDRCKQLQQQIQDRLA